ncbi:hypothetical protein TNCV_193731 [Trichonephila clavipes]|nr:hypothetical protein TNCV_193731 [Trichonephila clavipes]
MCLGHLDHRTSTHETPMDSADDLVTRTILVAENINSTPEIIDKISQSFLRQCHHGNDMSGWNFEQLLMECDQIKVPMYLLVVQMGTITPLNL